MLVGPGKIWSSPETLRNILRALWFDNSATNNHSRTSGACDNVWLSTSYTGELFALTRKIYMFRQIYYLKNICVHLHMDNLITRLMPNTSRYHFQPHSPWYLNFWSTATTLQRNSFLQSSSKQLFSLFLKHLYFFLYIMSKSYICKQTKLRFQNLPSQKWYHITQLLQFLGFIVSKKIVFFHIKSCWQMFCSTVSVVKHVLIKTHWGLNRTVCALSGFSIWSAVCLIGFFVCLF